MCQMPYMYRVNFVFVDEIQCIRNCKLPAGWLRGDQLF